MMFSLARGRQDGPAVTNREAGDLHYVVTVQRDIAHWIPMRAFPSVDSDLCEVTGSPVARGLRSRHFGRNVLLTVTWAPEPPDRRLGVED